MDQHAIFKNAARHFAEFCAVAAMTAPKSGGQLLARGAKPFIETVIVEDPDTLARLAAWLRERGTRLKDPIWFRDADVTEKLDLVLFIGLAHWYPPVYDCGACGYATCAQFLKALAVHREKDERDDWEFPGPICQIRCIDLGIAVGSAAKIASLNNVDARCQTRLAAAARHLGVIAADLAVALSMSVTHKNIFFDRTMPQITSEDDAADDPVPATE